MPDVDDTFRISIADMTQIDTSLIRIDSTCANYTWNYNWLVPAAQRVDTFYSPLFLNIIYNSFHLL